MDSSILEDFLKREVDQSQVNALVGTLENALGTSKSTVASTGNSVSITVEKITAGQNVLSQSVTSKVVVSSSTQSSTKAITTTAKIASTTSSPSISIKANGTIHKNNVVINAVSTSSVAAVVKTTKASITPPSSSNPPGGLAAAAIINGASPRVSIAPKSAVPIAPRLGANIVLTPSQAQILMAQQRFPLLQNNLIARMPGAVPVIPRLGVPGAIPVPPVMNTQIPGLGLPRGAIINMASAAKQDPRLMRMNIPLSTTVTAKQNANVLPGQINYRFRQVTPRSTQPTSVNGLSTNSTPITAATSAANVAMMKESVKRLKEFFQNLINLASTNQPPEIGKMVRELVHNLMHGKVSEEDFIEKLQKTLDSQPQPNLVHFLKKTLPHLRETIKKQQAQGSIAKSQAPNSTIPAASISIAVSRGKNQTTNPGIVMGSVHATPQQVVRKGLTIPPQMLGKPMIHQGRIIASTGQVTSGMNTVIPGLVQRGAVVAKGIGKQASGTPSTHKEKQKSSAYYSSASGADDDIIDVTCMAGVNLMEESQNILSSNEFMSYQTQSIKDKPILLMENLKTNVEKIAKKLGISEVTQDVLTIISHATEQHMRTILERLTACSLHRSDPHKDEVRYETTSDVRNQLKVFEEIDEVERKHRESREREILMRVAKSRSRTEDPEQARLKEKAKQMQLEEEEQNRKRAANRTALEAIGGPRVKKRKLDEALESLQNAQTPGNSGNTSSSTLSNSAGSNASQNIRSRQHRITMRDLILILETERTKTKSLMLYKSFLR